MLAWTDFHHWLTRHLIGIWLRVEGVIPPGTSIYRRQAPVDVRDRRDGSPGQAAGDRGQARARRHSILRLADPAVRHDSGRPLGRRQVASGAGCRRAKRSRRRAADHHFPGRNAGRGGRAPPLRAGFAGLYRALRLPVVPVAVDSGQLWGRGAVKRRGTVTFKVGETIPAGLKRDEVEARVHAAINALELASEARA